MSKNFGKIVRRFGSRIQIQYGIDGLYRVYLDKGTCELETASKREAIEFAEQLQQVILFGTEGTVSNHLTPAPDKADKIER